MHFSIFILSVCILGECDTKISKYNCFFYAKLKHSKVTDLLKLVVFTNNLNGCYGGYVPGTLSLKMGVERMFPAGKLNFQSAKTLGFLFKTNIPPKSGISTYNWQDKVRKKKFSCSECFRDAIHTHKKKEIFFNIFFLFIFLFLLLSFPEERDRKISKCHSSQCFWGKNHPLAFGGEEPL